MFVCHCMKTGWQVVEGSVLGMVGNRLVRFGQQRCICRVTCTRTVQANRPSPLVPKLGPAAYSSSAVQPMACHQACLHQATTNAAAAVGLMLSTNTAPPQSPVVPDTIRQLLSCSFSALMMACSSVNTVQTVQPPPRPSSLVPRQFLPVAAGGQESTPLRNVCIQCVEMLENSRFELNLLPLLLLTSADADGQNNTIAENRNTSARTPARRLHTPFGKL